MATVQDRKAPSAGTKVDHGDNPVRQEGAGLVTEDSLAAESYRADGDFTQNRNAEPEDRAPLGRTQGRTGGSGGGGGFGGSSDAQGREAPTYVNSQYTDNGGPRGDNLKEGGFDDQQTSDGQRKAFRADLGSIDDPARVAERDFEGREGLAASAAMRKDGELNTETTYDALDSDTRA